MTDLSTCLPGPSRPKFDVPEEPELPPSKKAKVEFPCDSPKFEMTSGQFRWASCECVVFEWSLTDPNEMANTEKDRAIRALCKSKTELHGSV